MTSSGRRHWNQNLSRRDLARPASSGGGLTFLLFVFVAAVIAAAAVAYL